MKNNFSPLPAECGEKKFFTAEIAILTNIHALISTLVLNSHEIFLKSVTVTDGAVE